MRSSIFAMVLFFAGVAEGHIVVVASNPLPYISDEVKQRSGQEMVVAVFDKAMLHSVKKVGNTEGTVRYIYCIPFSHTKIFSIYKEPSSGRISIENREGFPFFEKRKTSTLDEFLKNAWIDDGSTLIVDWGDDGYYPVRYSKLTSFSKVILKGLSDQKQKRLEVHFELSDFVVSYENDVMYAYRRSS